MRVDMNCNKIKSLLPNKLSAIDSINQDLIKEKAVVIQSAESLKEEEKNQREQKKDLKVIKKKEQQEVDQRYHLQYFQVN